MGKVAAFHDAPHYLASLTEVKSTSRLRLHVFFIVMDELWYLTIDKICSKNLRREEAVMV